MAMNAATAYQNNKIMTANSAELTLFLYDGAIKFCNIADLAIENKDITKAYLNIMKAEKIIAELRATLDLKYPVAQDFDRVYEYIYQLLVDANLKKDGELLKEATGYIREIRDTWKEVMQITK